MMVYRQWTVRRWHIRWLIMLIALGTVLLTGLVGGPAISAHAVLKSTSPDDGAVLETPPTTVTLIFNEAVSILPDTMQLYDASGSAVTLEATAAGPEVDMSLPDDLGHGTYTVGWRVISADSHPISGALTFSIGDVTATPVAAPQADAVIITPVMGIVNGLAYLGLLLAVGLPWFCLFISRQIEPVSVRMTTWAAGIAVLAHLLLIPLTAIRDRGSSFSALIDPSMWKVDTTSPELRALILVLVGLAVAVTGVHIVSMRRVQGGSSLLGGLLALGSLMMVGHTQTFGPKVLMYGADLLHGVAGSFWVGGLAGLSLFLARAMRARDSNDASTPGEATAVVLRFSFWAAVFVAGLALSGVVMALRILASWNALLHTAYGQVLIAKVLIVLLPLGLAAWNRFLLVPAVRRVPDQETGWRHLRITVLSEAALLVVVLGVTGFLVLQNPNLPGTAAGATVASAPLPYAQTAVVGDGTLHVRVSPGDTGENEVTVSLVDANGQPVALVSPPQVQLTLPSQNLGPLTTQLVQQEDAGRYTGTVEVPIAGEWTLAVATRISKFEEPITPFQISFPHIQASPISIPADDHEHHDHMDMDLSTGAIYMTLTNTGDTPDRLLHLETNAAEAVEIHEVMMHGSVMEMTPLHDGLEIPTGETVSLKTGDYHIMLIGLTKSLMAGESLELKMTFEHAGDVTVTVPILRSEPNDDDGSSKTTEVGDLVIEGVWSRPAPKIDTNVATPISSPEIPSD